MVETTKSQLTKSNGKNSDKKPWIKPKLTIIDTNSDEGKATIALMKATFESL